MFPDVLPASLFRLVVGVEEDVVGGARGEVVITVVNACFCKVYREKRKCTRREQMLHGRHHDENALLTINNYIHPQCTVRS